MNYINWKVNMQKVQKFMQILYWSWKVKNASELLSMYLKHNKKNQAISELYTNDEKTSYFSNLNDILKSYENFYEKVYTKRQPQKLLLLNFEFR